jgi:erythromycin esterase-like protein
MGDTEWDYLRHAVSKLESSMFRKGKTIYFKRSFSPYAGRDQKMFLNISQAIDLYLSSDEKVLIWSHLDHVSQRSLYIYPEIHPLGYYLNQCYGNEYYSIGLLAGEGTYTAVNPKDSARTLTVHPLAIPVKNSLESICLQTGHDYFFCPVEALSQDFLYMRSCGRFVEADQFYLPQYLPNRMDAFIFEKRSEGFEVPDIWKNPSELKRIKFKRRNKMLERINFPKQNKK